MASLKERKSALREFMASPKTMDAICNSIHLNNGSQVHKDLLRAIVQITAYGKEHVKKCGLLEPRRVLSDGTHCTTFDKDFQALVDRFLIELRAGVIFFPVILPNYAGWTDSFCRYWGNPPFPIPSGQYQENVPVFSEQSVEQLLTTPLPRDWGPPSVEQQP
jgi:hypothetical protein